MKLWELINQLQVEGEFDPMLEITGISYDSRDTKQGDLFVAINGEKFDGKYFIPDAKAKGAVAFMADEKLDVENLVVVNDTRKALAVVSREFYGRPDEKMIIVGVTGTNGKSTITHIIASIFNVASFRSAVVGTLGCFCGESYERLKHTTPESADLFKLLARLYEQKTKLVAMEVSSHGLFLKRVYGIKWAGAVFTNLTQDHLDFHKDMNSYFQAKKILFESLEDNVPAVANIDDPYGRIIADEFGAKRASLIDINADYRAEIEELSYTGTRLRFISPCGSVQLESNLIGRFNAYNILLASAMAHLLGRSLDEIAFGVKMVKPIRGRAERVDGSQPFYVFIDYAHTPDALEMILSSARELKPARIILVFGCGGDRDRTKRPKMGEIAAKYADILIVTSDNPRSEKPEKIIDEIVCGIDKHCSFMTIVDRKNAIITALELAKHNDIVIIAGKGHEDYQIWGDKVIHFDDKEIVEEWLRDKGYR